MSIHGLIKDTEFFLVLTADTSFTRGYINRCPHLVGPLDLWVELQSFVYYCEKESSRIASVFPYLPVPLSSISTENEG